MLPTMRRRVGAVAAAVGLCAGLAACGGNGPDLAVAPPSTQSSSSGSSITSASAGDPGCLYPGFTLPSNNPDPHGSTPQKALDAFIARGSIFGAGPEHLSATAAGYPADGWQIVHAGAITASFSSGKAQLDFSQVGDDSWVITGGQKNC
jgi:hypothetical protein